MREQIYAEKSMSGILIPVVINDATMEEGSNMGVIVSTAHGASPGDIFFATSGCNLGLSCPIKSVPSVDRFVLTFGLPFDVSVGDQFSIVRLQYPSAATPLPVSGEVGILNIAGTRIDPSTSRTEGTDAVTAFPIQFAVQMMGGYDGDTPTSRVLGISPSNEAYVKFLSAQPVKLTDAAASDITNQTAGADAVSNTENRIPVVAAGQVFNGTTWDRIRAVTAGMNSVGTGVLAAGIVAQVDDTATTAVTENNFGAVRMSTRRALLVEGVASGTAMPVNLTLLRGNNISAGAGVNGTGTLRVTMATDQAAIDVKSTLKNAAINAYTPIDYVSDTGNNSYQLTPFVINAAGAGNNTIVAAVAAKNHMISSFGFTVDAAVTMTWTDGTANLSGAMLLAPGIWYHMEGDKSLLRTGAVNRPIIMNLSAAVGIRGFGMVASY